MRGPRKCPTLGQSVRNAYAGKETCNRSDAKRFQSVTLLRQNNQPSLCAFDEFRVNVCPGKLASPPLQSFVQRAPKRKLSRRSQQQIAHAEARIVNDAAFIEFAAACYEPCRQIRTGKESAKPASRFQWNDPTQFKRSLAVQCSKST